MHMHIHPLGQIFHFVAYIHRHAYIHAYTDKWRKSYCQKEMDTASSVQILVENVYISIRANALQDGMKTLLFHQLLLNSRTDWFL